jgi:NAD+ diphosphatase
MNCESDSQPSEDIRETSYLLLFYNDEMLVKEQGSIIHIPSRYDTDVLNTATTVMQYCGSLNGNAYYAANICSKDTLPGFSFKKLRQLSGYIAGECLEITFRAFHIINWLKTNKFCGCCGGVMQVIPPPQELAVQCLACGHIVYPRISPAIIVAVIKEHEILLARSNRFPPGRYSVIAGFVEPGETLENCVRRELQEEVGIEVDNIEYFGNQPWPFPDSLMIAFTAQYANGEITIDNDEIVAAGWFSAATLPEIPGKGSISRQLIDWFLEKQQTLQTAFRLNHGYNRLL